MIARQKYPGEIAEVVIVDDSDGALRVPSLSAGRQHVHGLAVEYVSSGRLSVGAKRNVALSHCTGAAVVHWDDDDMYSPQRLREQLTPLVTGSADMTVLQHSFTYFLDRDELYSAKGARGSGCDAPPCGMTARPDFGPHFGTLVYWRSLHDPDAGVAFADVSEAEDYTFAQKAVELGATLRVVRSVATPSEPLFVCVRHGSNTWAWGAGHFTEQSARRVPSTILSRADYTFASRMRSEGVPEKLADRRRAAPAVHRYPPAGVDRAYFDALYAGAQSSAHLHSWGGFGNGTSATNLTTIRYFTPTKKYSIDAWNDCVNKCLAKLKPRNETECNSRCESEWSFSTYDLVTTAKFSGRGGRVGEKKTALADYGGVFHTTGEVSLDEPLVLFHYTTLHVKGDLRGEQEVVLKSFSTLKVDGNINVRFLHMDAFATLDVAGSVHIYKDANLSGGGVCNPFICDNRWHFPPGGHLPSPDSQGWSTPAFNVSLVHIGGDLTVARALNLYGCCTNVSAGGSVKVVGGLSLAQHLVVANESIAINGSVSLGAAGLSDDVAIGLRAGDRLDVYGNLSAYDGTLHVNHTAHIRGHMWWYAVGTGGYGLDTGDLVVDRELSLSRSWDMPVRGNVSVGNLSLSIDSHVSVMGKLEVNGSLTMASGCSLAGADAIVRGDAILSPHTRLTVATMQVEQLTVSSGGSVEAFGPTLTVGHLRLLSAAMISTIAPITVTHRAEVAPHVLVRCSNAVDYSAAGSGTLGQPPSKEQNKSAVCPWPANLADNSWEAHQPPEMCNAAVHVCGAPNSSDYTAEWLGNYLGRFHCLVGADGVKLFPTSNTSGDATNRSKACPV